MIKRDDVYKIGTIGKSHGVKGEVSLYFDDDVFDRVDADYPRTFLLRGISFS